MGKHSKPIVKQIGPELMDAWNGPEITGKDRESVRTVCDMAVMGHLIEGSDVRRPSFEFLIQRDGRTVVVTLQEANYNEYGDAVRS